MSAPRSGASTWWLASTAVEAWPSMCLRSPDPSPTKFVVSLTDATQEYVTGSSVHPDRFSMATSRVTHPSGAVDLGTTVTVIGKPSSWVAWGGGPLEGSSVVDSGPA